MKNRIVKKLRSQAGASITFALLLFLISAVLCSVIVTAASAASGRMSNLIETDQRYYAVTSAAELLKDLIHGKTVTIEKITEGIKTETYTYGTFNSSTDYDDDYTLKLNSAEVDESLRFSSIVMDAAYKYFVNNKTGAGSVTAPLTLESSDGFNSLNLPILENVDKAGNIHLTVGDEYKIELDFSASVIGPATTEVEVPDTIITNVTSDTEYTITTNMIKTETTRITWTLTGMKVNPVSGE